MIQLALILAWSIAAPVAPRDASPEVEVAEHEVPFVDALAAHAQILLLDGRSADAATLFAETYKITGDPRFLFGEAVVLASAGDCKTALARLEVFVASGPAQADLADAQPHIDDCSAAVAAGKDQTAAPEPHPITMEPAALFAEAYRMTGSPRFLYGEGTILVREGDCDGGVERLEAFIALGPGRVELADASQKVERCRRPPPSPTVVEAPAPSRRWFEDPTGGVLVGVGAVSLIAGGALLGSTHALAGSQLEAESRFVQRRKRVAVNTGVAIGLISVGSAVLIGGVIRYILVRRRAARKPAPWVAPRN